MSCKSVLSNSIKSNCEPPQWIKSQSAETNVKLAGDEAKDRLYEPKHKKKLVRVLTVIAYMFSVSLAAIMLSLYYMFIWNPNKVKTIASPGSSAVPRCNVAVVVATISHLINYSANAHPKKQGNEPKLERLIYQDMSYTTPESSAGIILTTDSGDTYDTTTGLKNSIFLQKLMSYAEDKFNLNETLY